MIYTIEESTTPGKGYDIFLNGSKEPVKQVDFYNDAIAYVHSDEAAEDAPWKTWTVFWWTMLWITMAVLGFCATQIPVE